MSAWRRTLAVLLLPPLLLAAGGCATIPAGAGQNPADPYERVNRQVYSFNDHFDRWFAKPVAQGYTNVVPRPVRTCVSNIFANVGEVPSFINATLQWRPLDAVTDIGRLVVNSTAGVLGCFDVATQFGWDRNRQDFGLTLGKWGLESGPYLVLPFLGPSSMRDAVGEIPDYFTDPLSYMRVRRAYYTTYAVRFVDKRAQLLDATSLVEQAALDPYSFIRDGYLQRRRSRVYDGNPPPPPDEDDPDSPADMPPATHPGAAAAPAPGVVPAAPPAAQSQQGGSTDVPHPVP